MNRTCLKAGVFAKQQSLPSLIWIKSSLENTKKLIIQISQAIAFILV
ncbi:hypothetical protein [Tolypothrix sp. VBCCA 56010]